MNAKKHTLSLDSRNTLNITAVDEVLSFDEALVSLSVNGSVLNVSGENLSVKNLSLDCGEISISGIVTAIVYFDSTPKRRFSLFGSK